MFESSCSQIGKKIEELVNSIKLNSFGLVPIPILSLISNDIYRQNKLYICFCGFGYIPTTTKKDKETKNLNIKQFNKKKIFLFYYFNDRKVPINKKTQK